MDAIEQLNPAIARRKPQQGMVRWLMHVWVLWPV